jgi:MFS family permease
MPPSAPPSAPPSDRNQLLILCFSIGLVFVSNSMIAPLVPLFSVTLGASPAVIGLIIAAAFLFPLFLAIPAGSLVDRYGPKGLILGGALLLGLSPFFVAFFPGFLSLALLQVVNGLGHLIAVVAAQSFVAALGSGALRERNFGLYTTFISIGQLFGPLLAGVVIDLSGYGAAFALAGIVALLATLLIIRLQEPKRPGLPSGSRTGPLFPPAAKVVELARNPGVQVGLLVSSTVMIALVAHQSFLPAYLDLLAYPATLIGVIVSLRALVTIMVRPFISQIITLLGGRFSTLLVMTVMVALGLGLMGYAQTFWALVVISALIGVGQGIAQPLTMVTVVDHVAPSERGTALGLRLSGNRLLQLSSPLLLGLIGQVAGYGVMFLAGGLAVAAAAGLLLTRRRVFTRLEPYGD